MRESRDEPERADGDGAEAVNEDGVETNNEDGTESTTASEDSVTELPDAVIDEVERLTRLAHDAIDEAEQSAYRERRDRLLAARDFRARVREEDTTLVCHPAEWIEDGTVRTERIEDVTRAVEIPLDGPGDPDDWADLDAHNRELVTAVRETHGEVHGANAAAFADFMGNHYAKPITSATRAELEEFHEEYFVRNAWPTERQRAVVDRSIELVFETADEPAPSLATLREE